jgi:hypothetical protein
LFCSYHHEALRCNSTTTTTIIVIIIIPSHLIHVLYKNNNLFRYIKHILAAQLFALPYNRVENGKFISFSPLYYTTRKSSIHIPLRFVLVLMVRENQNKTLSSLLKERKKFSLYGSMAAILECAQFECFMSV